MSAGALCAAARATSGCTRCRRRARRKALRSKAFRSDFESRTARECRRFWGARPRLLEFSTLHFSYACIHAPALLRAPHGPRSEHQHVLQRPHAHRVRALERDLHTKASGLCLPRRGGGRRAQARARTWRNHIPAPPNTARDAAPSPTAAPPPRPWITRNTPAIARRERTMLMALCHRRRARLTSDPSGLRIALSGLQSERCCCVVASCVVTCTKTLHWSAGLDARQGAGRGRARRPAQQMRGRAAQEAPRATRGGSPC